MRFHSGKTALNVFFIVLFAASLFVPFSDTLFAGQNAASGTVLESPGLDPGKGSVYKPAPRLKPSDYPRVSGVNPRLVVWGAAQMHLWFAAFILAVPIFVLIIEAVGVATGDERYDAVAYEFMRVSATAYSVTVLSGVILLFFLIVFYPALMEYLASILSPTIAVYAALIIADNAALYVYYRKWDSMRAGYLKGLHLAAGFFLNAAGTAIMFIANAWVTFMMTPGGVDEAGVFDGNVWHAVNNYLWSPMNLHRFIANIAYGGSIVGAYAAYRFLNARNEGERAHYDWMGYVASIVAIGALLPLPFAGYWLTAEIYRYSQQMGITLMGGVFGWLFIIQAVLIGSLFLAANYYLWCGLNRGEGGERYSKYVKYIAFVLLLCFLVWFTPHNIPLKPGEAASLGAQYHPYLAPLGLMPAKNTAVNIMLLFTFLSFILYRRASKPLTLAKTCCAAQAGILAAGVINIIWLGVYYGYFTDTVYKVASSAAQVATTVAVITAVSVMEFFMFRGVKTASGSMWGRMPDRSQYALILIAVSFTWLMGLMGYVRSAIRQHWHVYSVMRDSSADAFTPTIAYAAKVVSIGTIVFMAVVVLIFRLSSGADKVGADE